MFRACMGMSARAVGGSCALLAGLAVCVLAISPAQASTAQAAALASVQLTSGQPVKAVVSTPGQQVNYTFYGKAHKHVTFQVTNFNFSNGSSSGEVVLNFYKPGSTSPYKSCAFYGDDYCEFSPPITGTWKVKLVPVSASVGSLTLTFARDVATVALTSGTPVNTTIKFEGQRAGYTFAATAGKHVTFQVTNFNFSNGSSSGEVVLNFYKPGSTSIDTSCAFYRNDYCDVTPSISGTWSVELVPVSASVGSLTLTMS
jgi:archaellum component FlaF (FlaF/FlaG flagellin family)